MEEKNSRVFILVFGSPLIANDRMAGDRVGKRTREQVLDLIDRKGAFFLVVSGEIHFAEYTQLNFETRRGDPTDLYEVVSSGLTHTTGFNEAAPAFIMDTYNVDLLLFKESVDEVP